MIPMQNALVAPWKRRVAAQALDWSSDPILVTYFMWWMLTHAWLAWNVAAVLWALWLAWEVHQLATTGQSWGKRVTKIRLVDASSGAPIGHARVLGRWFAHLADSLPLYAGWFLPIVDPRGQTLADKMLRTIVVDIRP